MNVGLYRSAVAMAAQQRRMDAIAANLGLPPPPRVSADSVAPEIAGMLTADRRIANQRMKQLGITLRYPSWRTSLASM